MQIVCIWQEYLISYNSANKWLQTNKKVQLEMQDYEKWNISKRVKFQH